MAHSVDTMCSVMLGVLKEESNPSTQNASVHLLPSFIEDSKELQIFGSEKRGSLASWIGHINSSLNSAKTRLEGVSLLRALVSQCPSEVFQQHCASWVRLLTQILQSHDPPAIVGLASTALRNILKDATQSSELSRELSNTHIAPIITAALELKTQDSAVDVLSASIQFFPGPCGNFRSRIENFLVQLLGSNDNIDLAMSASRCLALLPRVGGGGQGGIKHTEAWSYYCYRVLVSIRGIVCKLYGDSEPEKQKESSHVSLEIPDALFKEPFRTYTLVRQFKVLCTCLQHLLRAEFPEIVKVPVNRVLSLCYRVLALNGKMLSKRVTLQWTLLAGSLSTIHSEAFDLLAALISSCRANLVPHGHMINKLFIQSLGWTMSGQSDDIKQRPYSGVRMYAYTTLEIWLEAVGTCSGIEATAEKLLEQILYDARPQTQTTKLRVTANKPAISLNIKSSGKATQKGQTASEESSPSLAGQQRIDPLANSQVCLASLTVLRCLLMSTGTKVKPDFHKDVHEFVISLLLRIQQATPDLTPAPYSSIDCRKALYHVLLASVIAPHPRWPAPVQCATSLFSRGRQDASITVASFCTEASVICQSIIHPRVPCLEKPLSIAELDPKRALSQSTFELWAESEHDRMDTTDVNGRSDLASRTAEGDLVVFGAGDRRVLPVDEDPPTGSEQTRPDVATVKTDFQSEDAEEEGEDSSDEDSDDQEIREDDAGTRGEDHQIKDDQPGIKEIILDNPEESFAGKQTQGSVDTIKEASTGDLHAESVSDVIVGSSDGKEIDRPTSSDSGKISLPTRRSKRHLTQLQKETRSTSKDAVGGDGSGDDVDKSKRRKKKKDGGEDRIQEDEIENEDKLDEGGMTDETDAMLVSFVDSLPDDD